MTKDTKDILPKEVANAVDLLANPVAGAVAMSAFGIGLASHAFGVWVGAMTGAAGVSKQFFDPEVAGQPTEVAKPSKVVAKSKRVKADVLAEDVRQSIPADKLGAADDLKAISGVGPKLEQVLNGLGIRSYGQIAAWTPDEIEATEETLGFNGRIVRDDWIGQAAALAGTKH
ncbi:NADH-ubiquinone dehydrogenase [Mesorhizobium sp. A623]